MTKAEGFPLPGTLAMYDMAREQMKQGSWKAAEVCLSIARRIFDSAASNLHTELDEFMDLFHGHGASLSSVERHPISLPQAATIEALNLLASDKPQEALFAATLAHQLTGGNGLAPFVESCKGAIAMRQKTFQASAL